MSVNNKNWLTKTFEFLTSYHALLVAAIGIITVVNELRLKVAVHEIKDANTEVIKEEYKEMRAEMTSIQQANLDSTRELVDKLALANGIVVNYGLIEASTKKAVNEGVASAIAHNNMKIEAERARYDTLYYRTTLGNYYRVIHNVDKDSINEIEIIDKPPNNIRVD